MEISMTQTGDHFQNQKGNILFLILIAVALFAALSYAVTQSTRSGGGDATKEKMAADAAAFIQYTAGLEAHIQRMNVGDGVAVDKFNFGAGGRGWTQPCNEDKCKVFTDTGGKFNTPAHPKNQYLIAPYQNSTQQFGNPVLLRVKGVGSDLADLVYYYQGFTEAFCKQLNKGLGLGEIAPIDTVSDANDLKYEFASNAAIPEPAAGADKEVGDQASELVGQTYFCFRNTRYSNSEAAFIQVLIAR